MKESGARQRKLLREKEFRDKQLLQKMPKLTGYFKPVNQDEEEGQMSSVPSGSGAGCGASEPSRHMSGSDSDGVAGEEKQTGGTFVLSMLNLVSSQIVVEETGG